MTVKKRSKEQKLDTTPIPCACNNLKYQIIDIAIFQRLSVNVPHQRNMVAFAVYDGGIKLCETETGFGEADSETIHTAICKAIKKDMIRLNLLKEIMGELFDVRSE